jgi:ferredoxin
MAEQNRVSARQWLVIGVDCLASFPEVDFEWRVRKAHSVEVLTRESLRFARQGGIAPYRFRNACQMCWDPSAQQADLTIEVIGIPVRHYVILSVRDEGLGRDMHLEELADGIAPDLVLSQRKKTLAAIAVRRRRTLEIQVQTLSDDSPSDLGNFLRYIANCTPCRDCIEACPNSASDFIPSRNGGIETLQGAEDWVQACVACGMCEDACPKHLPLTAILSQIAHPELAVPAAVAF